MIQNELAEQYCNKDYCLSELRQARELFQTLPVSREKYNNIQKALFLMYLYCPEEIQDICLSHIQEIEMRAMYLLDTTEEGGEG